MKKLIKKYVFTYQNQEKNWFRLCAIFIAIIILCVLNIKIFNGDIQSYNDFTNILGKIFPLYIMYRLSIWVFFKKEETYYEFGTKLLEEKIEKLEKELLDLKEK